MRNPKLIKRWLRALRSGKYLQGSYTLLTEGAGGDKYFCPLGILLDVYDPKEWFCAHVMPNGTKYYTYMGMIACVPKELKPLLGIEGLNLDEIMDLNDVKCVSFPRMADYIEERLPYSLVEDRGEFYE